MDLGLIFGQRLSNCLPKDSPPYGLVGFVDSNFTGNPEDQKSVMEYCFFLNGAVVSWYSKKQRTVSTSMTEASYIALEHTSRKVV